MKRFIVLAMLLPVLLACRREDESAPASQATPQPAPPATASQPSQPAPPQAQTTAPAQPSPSEAQVSPQTSASEPAASTAAGKTSGSSGDYTVTAGDTLSSIARDHSLNHEDVAKWNNIKNPNRIYPGQTLRLTEPTS